MKKKQYGIEVYTCTCIRSTKGNVPTVLAGIKGGFIMFSKSP